MTVLEAAPFLGGLAANFRHKGKEIPLFYHHIIKSNTTTLDYLRRFGKVRSLEWQRIQLTYPRIRNMNAALDSGIIAARTILEDGRKNGNTRG